MTDEEFLSRFEAGTLPSELFHHADHVHAAWLYLTRLPAWEAIQRFSQALRAYATSVGRPDRYHETITWAYLLLVNERIARSQTGKKWDQFQAANPDLFDWTNSILAAYYRPETLGSELARRVFLLPDRVKT